MLPFNQQACLTVRSLIPLCRWLIRNPSTIDRLSRTDSSPAQQRMEQRSQNCQENRSYHLLSVDSWGTVNRRSCISLDGQVVPLLSQDGNMDPPSLEPQLMMSAGTFVGVSLSIPLVSSSRPLEDERIVVEGTKDRSSHGYCRFSNDGS